MSIGRAHPKIKSEFVHIYTKITPVLLYKEGPISCYGDTFIIINNINLKELIIFHEKLDYKINEAEKACNVNPLSTINTRFDSLLNRFLYQTLRIDLCEKRFV